MESLQSERNSSLGKWIWFFCHLHPRKVDSNALGLSQTLGLGGISLVLFAMLLTSGSLMLLVYKPFPQMAYESIHFLETEYLFGQMVRNIHFLAANSIVITLFCHMLRVVFTSGHTGQRSSNWLVGMGIFSMVMASCFTGYLLPWDQTAFWAVTICLNMVEYLPWGREFLSIFPNSTTVTPGTLQLFFTAHTTFLPLALISLFILHFWKIRKARGLVFSNTGQGKTVYVDAWPHLFVREGVTALVVIAFILVVSLVFNTPLDDMANQGLSPNPAKAPWYFSGFQELLLNFHPMVAVFIIPFTGVLGMAALPWLSGPGKGQAIWFISPAARSAGVAALVTAVLVFPGFILFNSYGAGPGNESSAIPYFVLPALCIMIPGGMAGILQKKYRLLRHEIVQTLFIFFLSGFLIFSMTCIWLRGKGMALIWEVGI